MKSLHEASSDGRAANEAVLSAQRTLDGDEHEDNGDTSDAIGVVQSDCLNGFVNPIHGITLSILLRLKYILV